MMTRSRRQAGGIRTALLFIVAIIEIAIGWLLYTWWRGGACQPPMPASIQRALLGGGAAGPNGGNDNSGPGQDQDVQTQSQTGATSAPQGGGSTATGASAQTGAGDTSGSLNEVPDPNCVGKTTASLLGSGSSTPPPTCAPMKAPAELQHAAQQVQNMNGATSGQSQSAASPRP